MLHKKQGDRETILDSYIKLSQKRLKVHQIYKDTYKMYSCGNKHNFITSLLYSANKIVPLG